MASPPGPRRSVPGMNNSSAAESIDVGNAGELLQPHEGDIVGDIDQPELAHHILNRF